VAKKICVCGFGGPEGSSVFIDWESGVEVEVGKDGVSIRGDRDALDQLFCVLGGILDKGG
jgi:hypothetical protein